MSDNWDILYKLCKPNSWGEENRKARQHVTGNAYGPACRQQGKKKPPRVAKYNVLGHDSLGVKWEQWYYIPQTTPSLIFRCEALGGADWFHQQKQMPERAIHSRIDVHVHFGWDELNEKSMGLYTQEQMMKDPISGQISYNCCLLNAFKLKLGYDLKISIVDKTTGTEKESAT